MKRISATILVLSLAVTTLAGCNKKDSLTVWESSPQSFSDEPSSPPEVSEEIELPEDIELQKISELRGDLDRQIEAIRSADYKNLRALDNFTVTIPETDVLYELELTRPEFTFGDYYDKFDRIFDANYGDIYTKEDKAELYYAMAREDVWTEEYGYGNFTLAERRDKFESGELTVKNIEVNTDKARLEIVESGGIIMMYRDGIKNRSNFEGAPSSVIAENAFKTVKEAFDVDCGDRYELLDGEVSVKEAAAEVTQTIKEYCYIWGGDLDPEIYEYRVFDINDGKYGLEFEFAPFYKGVMLDCADVSSSSSAYGGDSRKDKLDHNYRLFPANVFIMESGKLETLRVGDGAYSVAELAEFDSVIPLDKAVEIAAEKFGEGMNLSLGSAELRYSKAYSKNEDETLMGAFPVWKLKLKNSVDGFTYITYINATTGEIEYYLT